MGAAFRRWRKIFWRWHRRIGICSLFFLAFMAITGIAINHDQDWSVLSKPLPYWLSSSIYSFSAEIRVQFDHEGQLVTQTPNDIFYNSSRLDSHCETTITGALFWQENLLLMCGTRIEIFNQEGLFIEEVPLLGSQFNRLAKCGEYLCIGDNQTWKKLDISTLEFSPTNETIIQPGFEKVSYPVYPAGTKVTPDEFDYARLMADLHNGSVFGRIGQILVDLSGLIILLLSATGCYLWLGNRRS